MREELRRLARPDTLVCRCEDVAMSRCEGAASIREAKLATRAGMGPCQGRVCGPALRFLHGWPPDSARPPLSPTSLAALMQDDAKKQSVAATGIDLGRRGETLSVEEFAALARAIS